MTLRAKRAGDVGRIGLGLASIRRRLNLLFGDRADIAVTSTDAGCVGTISLPAQEPAG